MCCREVYPITENSDGLLPGYRLTRSRERLGQILLEKVHFFYNVSKWNIYGRRLTNLFRFRKSQTEWLNRDDLSVSSLIFLFGFHSTCTVIFSSAVTQVHTIVISWRHHWQKIWNLNKGYGSWVDCTLAFSKRKEVTFSKLLVYKFIKEIRIF